MLKWIALAVVCVVSQRYTDGGQGVCVDTTSGNHPPNFSKNGQSAADCRTVCNSENLCVGYSHAPTLDSGAVRNRCAIWVDRTVLVDRGNLFNGWGMYNYPGWVENQLKIDSGDNAAGWSCYIRDDTCPANCLIAGTTVCYGVINQGQYEDVTCPSGYLGVVRIECRNGVAVKVGDGTCTALTVTPWTELPGNGVCRHINPPTAITASVGPGVSPPNFSKEGYTLEQCKSACTSEIPLICTGISYGGESGSRCALFINTDVQYCGTKAGWEVHAYKYGWNVAWAIDGVSGEANWKCHTREITGVTLQYQQMAGTGVCANSNNDSPSNYSRNGMSEDACQNSCTGYAQCLGFAHYLSGNRCAVYMNVHTQLPGMADWERHLGEPGWPSDPQITKADQVGTGWLCFKKIVTASGRRKN